MMDSGEPGAIRRRWVLCSETRSLAASGSPRTKLDPRARWTFREYSPLAFDYQLDHTEGIMNKVSRSLMFLALLALVGCGPRALTPQEKLKLHVPNASRTTPVRGKLLVDGKPTKDISVYLIPKGSKMPKGELPAHRAVSKADGSFAIMTYLEGDGAPAGEYVICMEWLTYRPSKDSWVGPDKLGNRYNDPDKSEFAVTVDPEVEGFLDIEISTAGVDHSQTGAAKTVQRESKRN